MNGETIFLAGGLALLLLFLILFLVSRLWNSGEPEQVSVVQDGHGASHDEYTHRGRR